SFVAELSARGSSAAVVRAIVALAESLGIEVIAEGIETTQQCRVLMGLGCTIGQGFLYSKPLPIAQLP
ncbi:MAG: EAL domain-containing protein, partial [Dokdonella sp.]